MTPVVAKTWTLTAGRKMPIPSDRVTVTVSAEWLAVIDGDHKMTFSGRRPTSVMIVVGCEFVIRVLGSAGSNVSGCLGTRIVASRRLRTRGTAVACQK